MVNKVVLTSIIVLFADQITKYFADNSYPATFNSGIAFGLFQGNAFVFRLSIIAAIVVIFLILRYSKDMNGFGAGLLLGGTVGNLIDRIYYKFVIDWISIGNFPSFNIADAANVIGVLIIIISGSNADEEKILSQS
jgi:lipoprotein signal peptidase